MVKLGQICAAIFLCKRHIRAGNRFQDLRYTITLDFDHDKIFWTSTDFQGINTLVRRDWKHDITRVEYEDELFVIKCTMFHPSHKQLVNETILLKIILGILCIYLGVVG